MRVQPETRDSNEFRTGANYNQKSKRNETFSGEIKNHRPSEFQWAMEPPVTNE
jgi:hypothetical protein